MSLELYPMPLFPTLAVANLAESTRWYQDVLGFHLVFSDECEPGYQTDSSEQELDMA